MLAVTVKKRLHMVYTELGYRCRDKTQTVGTDQSKLIYPNCMVMSPQVPDSQRIHSH